MNLQYALPQQYDLAVRGKLMDREVLFCVPFDLSAAGSFTEGYLLVTDRALYVLQEGELLFDVVYGPDTSFEAVELISSGAFEMKKGKETYTIVNYTMEHLARYAYIAQAMEDLCHGRPTHVESNEEGEKKCPKCGKPFIRHTKFCPNCADKGSIIRRLAHTARPCLPIYLAALVLYVCGSAIALWQPAVSKGLINNVLDPATRQAPNMGVLLYYVGLLALAGLLSTITTILRDTVMTYASSRLSRDLKSMVYQKIQGLSIGYLDGKKTGDLMNRINSDTSRIQNFIRNIAAQGISELFLMVGALFVLFAYDWKLSLIVLIPTPFIILSYRLIRRQIRRRYHMQWRKMDKLNSLLNDILRGIRVVKAFGQEERAVTQFQEDAAVVRDVTTRNEKFFFSISPITTFIMGIGSYFLIFYCGSKVLRREMTIGELVQFTTYASFFFQRLRWFSNLPRWLNESLTSAQRIFEVMDEDQELLEQKLAEPEEIKGDIVFDNVTFGYKSYHAVLKNINVTVREGEMIGLVGHSGAGKSTVINLLMRLYDPDNGRITIGGRDIRDFSQHDYKSKLGIVLQETFLFSGTIAQNIAYAKEDATLDEVIRAAKIANAHDFISSFPDAYDTRVGEKGQRLSGGERQRIAIARAVLCNPQVLILDEATASVDTETEQQIQEALSRVIKNRTTFAIAHRLSTLKNADRIMVLDKGHLAELGTHDELMRKKGIYYSLVEAQRKMSAVKAIEG